MRHRLEKSVPIWVFVGDLRVDGTERAAAGHNLCGFLLLLLVDSFLAGRCPSLRSE